MGLETIARFRDVPAAQLAQSRLEADGIPASLLGVNHVGINWLISQAIGGIRLQVPAEDAEHARELLQQDRSEDLEGVPEADLPAAEGETCPRCGSDRVQGSQLAHWTKAASMLGGIWFLLLSLPFVWWRRRLDCSACGFSWEPEPR